jgi:hypothetical protein
VRITIDDDGPGIPDAEIEYAFEPFRRFEPTRNRSTGGVGLGLTIAHQTFEREGGNLRVMNRSEGGLRAEIILPLDRRKSANASKPCACPFEPHRDTVCHTHDILPTTLTTTWLIVQWGRQGMSGGHRGGWSNK